jgi:hypothetical protein
MRRLLPVLLLSGCDLLPPLACTDIGCTDSLFVELVPATGEIEPGVYTATLAGDTTETCTFTVGSADGCERCVVESDCDVYGVSGSDGDRLTWTAGVVEGAVVITVERDGEVLLDDSFTPAYTESEPNGPGCPPTCTQGNASFAI